MSVSKRGQTWEVRWRVGNQQHSKSGFKYKRDAEAFEADQQARIKNNTFTSPKEAKSTLAVIYTDWIDHKDAAPRTQVDYRELWKTLIAPTWGTVKLEQIKPDGVTKWVYRMNQTHSPARVRKAFTVFNQILDFAVLGEKIQTNPVARAKQLSGKNLLPKVRTVKAHRYLTVEEVFAFANACDTYRTMYLTMAFTGVRFGEATALQVKDIDLLRNRLLVQRAWTSIQGKLIETTPKSGKAREVPIPQLLVPLFQEIIERSESPDSLFFTAAKGGPIHYARWRRDFFDKAVHSAGIPSLTPHDLRHTYASVSIQAGVGPKALQVAMGHSDIRLTMDTYAGLFETDKDDHAARLDAAASGMVSQTNVRKMFA